MFFSELEAEINTIPRGVLPLYKFLDFILDWYEQSEDYECLVNTEEYAEIIHLLKDEVADIFPDFISSDFLGFVSLMERENAMDISQMIDSIELIKLQIERYYETKQMLYSPDLYENSEVEELDNSMVFDDGLSKMCIKRINHFCTKIHTSMHAMEIQKYILNQIYPVEKKEIIKRYGNINKFTLSLVLSKGDIINCRNTFFAVKNIVEDRNVYLTLNKCFENTVQRSATELHKILMRNNNCFLKQNHISTPLQLYMILSHLYVGDFNFSWPFISSKIVEIKNQNELISEYLQLKDNISVADLLNYAHSNDVTFPSTIDFLDSLNNFVILKSKDELISISKLNIRASKIKEIKKLLVSELKTTKGMAIRDLTIIHKLPKLDIVWNEWLIYSIVKKYIPDLCVALSSTQFRFSVPVIALTHTDLTNSREAVRKKYSNTRVAQVVFAIDNLDDIDNLIVDYLEFELDEDLI